VMLVKERETKAKHQQIVSGTGLAVYWVSNLIADLSLYMISVVAALLVVATSPVSVFHGENFWALATLMCVYGLSVMPLTYLLSMLFDRHANCQTALQILYQTVGFLMLLCMLLLDMLTVGSDSKWVVLLRILFYILPNFDLTYGLVRIVSMELDGRSNPFAYGEAGAALLAMGIEGIVFFALVLNI